MSRFLLVVKLFLIILCFIVLPQIHPFTFGDDPANAGDTVGVACMVSKGDTPLNITWLLNGLPATNTQGVTINKIGHKSSSLSIDSVLSIHNGVYTCSVGNAAGHTNYSAALAVNGKSIKTKFSLVSENAF